jgi:hypothetical protein
VSVSQGREMVIHQEDDAVEKDNEENEDLEGEDEME